MKSVCLSVSVTVSLVVFLVLVLVFLGVMTWLVLEPGLVVATWLQLYRFPDINFRMLLVAVVALNFITCFLLEVWLLEFTSVTYDGEREAVPRASDLTPLTSATFLSRF